MKLEFVGKTMKEDEPGKKKEARREGTVNNVEQLSLKPSSEIGFFYLVGKFGLNSIHATANLSICIVGWVAEMPNTSRGLGHTCIMNPPLCALPPSRIKLKSLTVSTDRMWSFSVMSLLQLNNAISSS